MKTYISSFFTLVTLALISFYTTTVEAQKNRNQFVVVLDAGHGGTDPGNTGNGFKEKDIALNIVLEVGRALEKHPNIKVIYTRKTDVFVTLRGRAKIANDNDADLFVSVHCNAHGSNAHGTETFVLGLHANDRNFEVAKKENEVIYLEKDYELHYDGFNPNSPESLIYLTLAQEDYLDQSTQLASLVQDQFTTTLKRNNRGVKQAGFWVLHNTYMPSILIETGFLTYKPEGAYLNSKKGQSDMSLSIYKGIIEYKRTLDQNVGAKLRQELSKNTPSLETLKTIDQPVTTPKPEIFGDYVFKVQLAASSKKLETKAYNFNGLSDISMEKEGKIFKYFYGQTSDYAKAKKLAMEAKKKGYNDSFIVAYKNGVKADLSEVLKSSAN